MSNCNTKQSEYNKHDSKRMIYVSSSSSSSSKKTSSKVQYSSAVTTISSTSISSSSISSSSSSSSTSSLDLRLEESISSDKNNESITNGKKCMWSKCDYVESGDSLMEHLQTAHVNSQKSGKKFKCLWKGCRVYKAQSSSFAWLERHAITHADTKPYACIINGCKRKFPTQSSLEKHVNSHMNVYENMSPNKHVSNVLKSSQSTNVSNGDIKPFNGQKTSNQAAAQSLTTSGSSSMLNPLQAIRQNSKLISTRKRKMIGNGQLKKAQYKDFIDEYSASVVKDDLDEFNFNSGTIQFKANLIAHKKVNNLNYYLVEWLPKNMLENEWVEESAVKPVKEMNICDLKAQDFSTTSNKMYRKYRFRESRRK